MYLFLKKELAGAKVSAVGTDEVDVAFDAAKKIAREAVKGDTNGK